MLTATTTRSRTLTAYEAEDAVRAAGLVLMEPYSGWPTRRLRMCCATCSTEHRRTLIQIQQGWTCPHTLHGAGMRMDSVSAQRAAAEAGAAGYQPQEPYPGRTTDPWRLRCTMCGQLRTPSLKDIRRRERCQHGHTNRTAPEPPPPMSEDTRHRLALARQITAPGDPWRAAIEQVPRHLLTPAHYINPGPWQQITAPDRRYLPLLYADRPLVTALGPPTPGSTRRHPSATTPSPSLLHGLLSAADLDVDQQILDIGTGCGYTAALLCERFGEGSVTTTDTDPHTAALAACRLAATGYHPRVQTGSAAAPATPYDRIVAPATSLSTLPAGWFTRTPRGAVIVARLGTGYVRAVSHGDGTGTARFLDLHPADPDPDPGARPPAVIDVRRPLPVSPGATSSIPVEDLIAHGPPPTMKFALDLALPGHRWQPVTVNGAPALRITTPDQSVATVLADGTVCQRGRRRLWRTVEHLHRLLPDDPAAPRTAFGITITPDHRQTLWYETESRTLCALT
ncbi:protein-L-isoaspartate O-methyltransferase family protein [Streptomyces sp. G-5]|uniref:protein-L-isoaspartate O-methyltransferase family protein n=1 Tax=Streptomyces sp. G-5 TaxID=2977231 RepID=UPI0021D2C70A|nr:hypothetical protein [Streptomyces sp. G-5]MCU4750236.1 hypothetical protein [Streptomyces sp. G-5]